MNKKILGLIAASVTVFGTAISAAPASANVEQTVDVEVNVAPALFLRTFDRVEINVTANGADSSDTTTGGPIEGLTAEQLTQAGPGSLGEVQSITKEIPVLYAVWGNEGSVNVEVEATTGSDTLELQGVPTVPRGFAKNARISNATATLPADTTLNPVDAVVGGATVDIEFGNVSTTGAFTPSNAFAGQYTGGKITVRATQQ